MIQHITKPFKYFFKLEAASGLILLFAAILALVISNGTFSEIYFTTLEKKNKSWYQRFWFKVKCSSLDK